MSAPLCDAKKTKKMFPSRKAPKTDGTTAIKLHLAPSCGLIQLRGVTWRTQPGKGWSDNVGIHQLVYQTNRRTRAQSPRSELKSPVRKPLRRPRFWLIVSSEVCLVVLNEHTPPVRAKPIGMPKSQGSMPINQGWRGGMRHKPKKTPIILP